MNDDTVYKLIELTGTSQVSVQEAIQNAITKAGKTVRNLRWFQVTEIRGALKDGAVSTWQVTLKVGFVVED
jgi:dodecin